MGFAVSQAQNAPAAKEPGINVNYMDKNVKPSNDFFRYVNGTWLTTPPFLLIEPVGEVLMTSKNRC
jgi:hypothetical protein